MSEWTLDLQKVLLKAYPKKKADSLYARYAKSFGVRYRDQYPVETALSDIERIETLNDASPITLDFYRESKGPLKSLHLRLYKWQLTIPLSEILPIFEHFGLRVENDNPDSITLGKDGTVYLNDFVIKPHAEFELQKIKPLFLEAFVETYSGWNENDGFNQLVVQSSLTVSEVKLLRAYCKYLKQINFHFTQHYIEQTLVKNQAITQKIVELFMALHAPNKEDKKAVNATGAWIDQALSQVASLDEDTILRKYVELVHATVRTNYFKSKASSADEAYLSFKFQSAKISSMPEPVPLFEIFVYSTRFEGIHLRYMKVARGGIRWSDRLEDYRTEVLGLMKAQKVKNAVIVPSGAKGGFVLKKKHAGMTREEIQKEVVTCYKCFIRGLLDLTDNLEGDKVIRPEQVVCHDDVDPYLVVAADKGTASFSDTANGLAKDYHFWLGDAFASGGSKGYDHKRMGITARGAFESVKRHFRELDIDIMKTPITVIGVGDMSGDVFGNGLLYTDTLCLVAAFDHRHIFIDPKPDAKKSFQERLRLAQLPLSSWDDYNKSLLSKGGGVFPRSAKSIVLTAEMKVLLGTELSAVTPNECIRLILKTSADLFFNGGIGTYVKATTESHADVGDRLNDYTRVNGNELRVKVVGEGGNLGFTQLGRVEFAQTGGLINTDFIDNSGGVDCSDHEVNLKILLDGEIAAKRLTSSKRDDLLKSLTEEVAALVLEDNMSQALTMSYTAFHAARNLSLHIDYLKDMESLGFLDRRIEFISDDKKLVELKTSNSGLSRPELAVLLAYTKIQIKNDVLKSNLVEDSYLTYLQETAFPPSIRKKYQNAIANHRLRPELFATQMSNQVVNLMGITFVYRMQLESSASIADILRAYVIATEVFQSHELIKNICALDYKIPVKTQYDMLFQVRNLINLTVRWFLTNHYVNQPIAEVIDYFKPRVKTLEKQVTTLMSGYTRNYFETLVAEFMQGDLPKELAMRIGTYRAIYTTLNIIEVAKLHRFDLSHTSKVYFAVGECFNLVWFRDEIGSDAREGRWPAMAKVALRAELDFIQRELCVCMIQYKPNERHIERLVKGFKRDHEATLQRWSHMLSLLYANGTNTDYSMFFIALKSLEGIIESMKVSAVA